MSMLTTCDEYIKQFHKRNSPVRKQYKPRNDKFTTFTNLLFRHNANKQHTNVKSFLVKFLGI